MGNKINTRMHSSRCTCRGVFLPRRLYLQGGRGGCTCRGYLPEGCTCPGTSLLWTEFLTHATENITLPQTSFMGGKNMAHLKTDISPPLWGIFSHFMRLLIYSLFLLLFADRLAVGRLPLPTSRCRHRFWQSNCFPRFLPKQSINTIHFCGLPSHNE